MSQNYGAKKLTRNQRIARLVQELQEQVKQLSSVVLTQHRKLEQNEIDKTALTEAVADAINSGWPRRRKFTPEFFQQHRQKVADGCAAGFSICQAFRHLNELALTQPQPQPKEHEAA